MKPPITMRTLRYLTSLIVEAAAAALLDDDAVADDHAERHQHAERVDRDVEDRQVEQVPVEVRNHRWLSAAAACLRRSSSTMSRWPSAW